jgi:hypothetical protein
MGTDRRAKPKPVIDWRAAAKRIMPPAASQARKPVIVSASSNDVSKLSVYYTICKDFIDDILMFLLSLQSFLPVIQSFLVPSTHFDKIKMLKILLEPVI